MTDGFGHASEHIKNSSGDLRSPLFSICQPSSGFLKPEMARDPRESPLVSHLCEADGHQRRPAPLVQPGNAGASLLKSAQRAEGHFRTMAATSPWSKKVLIAAVDSVAQPNHALSHGHYTTCSHLSGPSYKSTETRYPESSKVKRVDPILTTRSTPGSTVQPSDPPAMHHQAHNACH